MKINKYYSPDGGGGNGEGDDPNLTKFEELESKGYTNLSQEEKVTYDSLKDKYSVEYVGDDGKPLPPEEVKKIKEVEAKVKTILAKPEDKRSKEEQDFILANTEKNEDEVDIYEEVNALTGFNETIDYGDIDPKSPQGIAKRELTIAEKAQENYDRELKEKYPEAYRYFEYIQRGGKAEDYFKPINRNWKEVNLVKTDTETQERVYRQALEMRGNRPAQIDALVQLSKDKGKLYEDSKAELEVLQTQQEADELEMEQNAQRAKQQEAALTRQFYDTVTKQLQAGIGGNPLSAKDQREFYSFVTNSVKYYKGKFVAVRELDLQNLGKELQAEFFRFKGGDLKGVVDRQVKTAQALRVKGAGKVRIVPRATSTGGSGGAMKLSQL